MPRRYGSICSPCYSYFGYFCSTVLDASMYVREHEVERKSYFDVGICMAEGIHATGTWVNALLLYLALLLGYLSVSVSASVSVSVSHPKVGD